MPTRTPAHTGTRQKFTREKPSASASGKGRPAPRPSGKRFATSKSSASPVSELSSKNARTPRPSRSRDDRSSPARLTAARPTARPQSTRPPADRKQTFPKIDTGGEPIRLNRFIAMCGEASRRKADEMIANGEVAVNGAIVTELGFKVNRTDRVLIGGRMIHQAKSQIYILMNKPKDAITTNADELHRRTVIDVLNLKDRVFAVGRLDRNTTGALLLTNDGDLATRLMHPSSEVQKDYEATLSEKMSHEALEKLKAGLRLKDTGERTRPCEGRVLDDGYTVWLSIHEGKNRQVHRMFEAVGYEVVKLQRVSYAGLALGKLKRGEWRYLEQPEVAKLYKRAGLTLQTF